MADTSELFRILQDDGTGAGEGAISRVEGESSAAKAGLIGFSFKDSSGNVVLPALNSSGQIPVAVDGLGGTCIDDNGVAGGSVGSFIDVVTLVLALTKVYEEFEFIGSCTRTTLWHIVHIDDVGGTPTESIKMRFITGPGQFSVAGNMDCPSLDTTGGTGTQNLVLRGKNQQTASDLHGYLGVIQRP